MNNTRRISLNSIIIQLRNIVYDIDSMKINSEIMDIQNQLDDVCSDEETALDNVPESLMFTDRYTTSEECIDKMKEALDLCDELSNSFEEKFNDLRDEIDRIIELLDETVNL